MTDGSSGASSSAGWQAWLVPACVVLGVAAGLVASADPTVGLVLVVAPMALGAGLLFLSRPAWLFLLFVILVAAVPQVPDAASISGERYTFLYAYKVLGGLSIMDTLFVTVVLVSLAAGLLSGRLRIPLELGTFGVVAFAGMSSIALLRGLAAGNDLRFAGYEFLNINRFWIFYFLGRCHLRRREYVDGLMRALLVVAVALGILGFLKYVLGRGVDLYGVGQKLPLYDSGSHLVILLSLLGLLDSVIARKLSARRAGLILLLLAPAVWTFLVSYRRGLWLALAAGMLVMFFLSDRRLRVGLTRRLTILLGVGVLGVVLAAAFSQSVQSSIQLFWDRLASMVDVDDPNNMFRYYDTLNALEAIDSSPIFGLGLGSFYPIVHGNPHWHAYAVVHLNSVSHNTYLYIPMKLGLLALVFFLLMMFSQLAKGMAKRTLRRDPPFLTALSFLFGYLLFLVTAPGLLFMAHAMFLGLAMACLDAPWRS